MAGALRLRPAAAKALAGLGRLRRDNPPLQDLGRGLGGLEAEREEGGVRRARGAYTRMERRGHSEK